MPQPGDQTVLRCVGRDFGVDAASSAHPYTATGYPSMPAGQWWGPAHPHFGTGAGAGAPLEGMVGARLDVYDRKPVYKAHLGDNAEARFRNWFNTDTRPVDKDASPPTPINMEVPVDLVLTWTAGAWVHDSTGKAFFMNGKGFQPDASVNNFHFTVECRMRVLYTGGETFSFEGGDDMWMFIGDELAVDAGGLHGSLSTSVALDTLSHLRLLKSYTMSIFYAERQCCESNFKITTSAVAPPPRELCLRASIKYPDFQQWNVKAITDFPPGHAWYTRTRCGGYHPGYGAALPFQGPSFSPGCKSVGAGELLYALNSDGRAGSESPIAGPREAFILSVIDDVGLVWFVIQGGTVPAGQSSLLVVDVSVTTDASSTTATSDLAMLHSPNLAATSTAQPAWDNTKVDGAFQRLNLAWKGPTQTAGAVIGPFKGTGACVRVKVVESGLVTSFKVGTMARDPATGNSVLSALPIYVESLQNKDGVSVCAHDCGDPCTNVAHSSCDDCLADAACGWHPGAGCFGSSGSRIKGLRTTADGYACPKDEQPPTVGVTPTDPASIVGTGPSPGSGNSTGGGLREGVLFEIFGLEITVETVVIASAATLVVCCCCMLCCVWWCRRKCRQRRARKAGGKPAVAGRVQEMPGRRMKKNPMANKVHMRKETKLPKNWAGQLDPEGYKFYHNEKTGEVSWDAPEGTLHSGPIVMSAALAAAANSSGVKAHIRKSTVLPPGWSAMQDEEGYTFYVDATTARTSWKAPKGTRHSGKPMDKKEVAEMLKAEKAKAEAEAQQMEASGGAATAGKEEKMASIHERNETVLPVGYSSQFDEEGYKFYLDMSTGAVSWEPPPGAVGGSTGK